MTRSLTRTFTFDDALRAVPELRAVDRVVRMLVALAPGDGRPMCAGCVWELVIKPLTVGVIGWGRAWPHKDCHDPTDTEVLHFLTPVDWAELDRRRASIPVATNDLESWLRTSDAYDVVTDRWLAMLDDADPACDHGLPR